MSFELYPWSFFPLHPTRHASQPTPNVASPNTLSTGRRATENTAIHNTLATNNPGTHGQPGTRNDAPSRLRSRIKPTTVAAVLRLRVNPMYVSNRSYVAVHNITSATAS